MTKAMENALRNSQVKSERVDTLINQIKSSTNEQEKHMLRLQLLRYLCVNMHKLSFDAKGNPRGGKIAGIPSIDGNAMGTPFCQKMRELAKKYPELKLICGCCYACGQQEVFKVLVQMAHLRNVRILSEVEFTEDELATIYIPADLERPFCRNNEDGDTVNVTHARNLIRIAKTHICHHFGWWYKHRTVVYIALDELGKPENIELIFSVPTISAPIDRIKAMAGRYDDKVFAVFETAEEVDRAVADGFVRCNGVKCYVCGYRCYRHHDGGVLYIAEQMRK